MTTGIDSRLEKVGNIQITKPKTQSIPLTIEKRKEKTSAVRAQSVLGVRDKFPQRVLGAISNHIKFLGGWCNYLD